MKAAPPWIFAIWCLSGLVLLHAGPGRWDWWDAVWCLLAALVSHQLLTDRIGLNAARIWALGLLLAFSAAFVLVIAAFGDALAFTSHAGPRIAGALPVLAVVLSFAVLVFSRDAIERGLPWIARPATALLTGVVFTATLLNSLVFFTSTRLWWIWNPLGQPDTAAAAFGATAIVAICATISAWLLPPDVRMHRKRMGAGLVAVLAINLLFAAAGLTALWR